MTPAQELLFLRNTISEVNARLEQAGPKIDGALQKILGGLVPEFPPGEYTDEQLGPQYQNWDKGEARQFWFGEDRVEKAWRLLQIWHRPAMKDRFELYLRGGEPLRDKINSRLFNQLAQYVAAGDEQGFKNFLASEFQQAGQLAEFVGNYLREIHRTSLTARRSILRHLGKEEAESICNETGVKHFAATLDEFQKYCREESPLAELAPPGLGVVWILLTRSQRFFRAKAEQEPAPQPEAIIPENRQQIEPVTLAAASPPPEPVDPFADLRRFARAELKGQERAVMEALCDAGGKLPLSNIKVLCDWQDPIESAWNSLRTRLNKKLEGIGRKIKTHGGAARLTDPDSE